jgi:hypothetical protein
MTIEKKLTRYEAIAHAPRRRALPRTERRRIGQPVECYRRRVRATSTDQR